MSNTQLDAGSSAPAPVCSECGAPKRDPLLDADANSTGNRFVYALGRIEARFPFLSIEKEFAQATGRARTAGLTDRQALHEVLTAPGNRYLARQLCWILTIKGLETYVLMLKDATDLEQLVGSLRPIPGNLDVDAVVGVRGPPAALYMCNGLALPTLLVTQVYSFDRDALVAEVPAPANGQPEDEEGFRNAVREVFDRVMLMVDNIGATDRDRALNYLVLRYPAVYALAAQEFKRDFSLSAVSVNDSPLSVGRRISDVVFTFKSRVSDYGENWIISVDVTEEFPFLVRPLGPYVERSR